MASKNQFDLPVGVDNDDPSHLIAAAEKKAAASPKPDDVHPRRAYEMKREGAGRGNWGTVTDEGLAQETVETVNTEETAAAPEDEKNPDDAPQSEVEKDKEGAENEEEEKEPEDREMTLDEYEIVLELKRKAFLALKAGERKVEVDKEFQSMLQLLIKKGADEVFIKLGSDKDLKKKENAERDERAKKSLSINEFLKPAEGERGGFRGSYNGGGGRGQAAAPAIEDSPH